jgi:hypothetical protein
MSIKGYIIFSMLLSIIQIRIGSAQSPQGEKSIEQNPANKDTCLYSIKGMVSDENGEAIPGATIRIDGTFYGAASNIDGTYKIEKIPLGKYNISSTAIGYNKLTITSVNIPHNGDKLNFKLKSGPFIIYDPIYIRCSPPIDKYSTTNTWSTNSNKLSRAPAKNIDRALLTRPGITR